MIIGVVEHMNKLLTYIISALLIFSSSTLQAGTDFGTDAELRQIIEKFSTYITEKGNKSAIEALGDRNTEFGGAKTGLMIWIDGKMGAHNKYPELKGINFADLQDLREQFVMQGFTEAADAGGDYALNYWPHYDNEEEYEYHCFSKWISKPSVMISACR